MLKHIIYTFPNGTADSQIFFQQLIGLLAELPNASINENGNLEIVPLKPAGAVPTTVFSQSDVPFPQLDLGDNRELSMTVGNFRINPDVNLDYEYDDRGFDEILIKHDSLGTYIELHAASLTFYRLPLNKLIKRLKGHVVRIDHTGVNIPSTQISNKAWKQLIDKVASQTNLYKYPTNNVWPFILPATEDEFETDITQFPDGREPKFELVYDTYDPNPTIQIDIETDLTRVEVEQLLPEPYGVSFPEVADFFRTVYIHHEWLGLAIRFDIRFKSEGSSDWGTGEWLVKDGGRVTPQYPPLA